MALVIRGTEAFRDGPLAPIISIPMLSFLGISRRRSPHYGEQWVATFESPASNNPEEPSAAEVGYNSIPSDFEAQLEAIGPIYRLTVIAPDFPQGGSIGVQQTNFELLGNVQQKDIREHPNSLNLGGNNVAASATIVDAIDAALDNRTAYTSAVPNAVKLYNRLKQRKGSMAFQMSQYALRWTRLASNRASISVGYANVGRVYTTAQMLAETGPPSGILASIEDAATQLQSAATLMPDHSFGWLKQTPTVTLVAGNKVQISGEYWFEAWDTGYVYGAAT